METDNPSAMSLPVLERVNRCDLVLPVEALAKVKDDGDHDKTGRRSVHC
jgi:hypothetical protein